MTLYNQGEQFCELWSNIPECQCYLDYCGLLNYIEDCHTNHEITKKDYNILTSCLEHYAQINGWNQ